MYIFVLQKKIKLKLKLKHQRPATKMVAAWAQALYRYFRALAQVCSRILQLH